MKYFVNIRLLLIVYTTISHKTIEGLDIYAKTIATVTPVAIIAAVGTDVRIKCNASSSDPVIWETTPCGKSRPQIVYDRDRFVDRFQESGRFALDGSHDLLIRNVELNDAGSFVCTTPTKHVAELIVTDSINCTAKDPTSKLMGENEFSLPQSIMQFSCSLQYRGNIPPVFQCTANDNPLPGKSTSSIADSNSAVVSGELNSVVAVKKLNGTVIACKVVVNCGLHSEYCSSILTNVHWESEALDIKFAALENRPVEQCPDVDSSLLCNPPCSYEQRRRADGSSYCQANYTLDGKAYFLQVNSSCQKHGKGGEDKAVLIILAILICITLVVVTVTALCYFRRKIKRICCQRGIHSKKTECH